MGFPPYHSGFIWLHEKLKRFWEQSLDRTDNFLLRPIVHANSNNEIVRRKEKEAFCILEEFDFLKHGLASAKECMLKARCVGWWGTYIYHSPQFKRVRIKVTQLMWDHVILFWMAPTDPITIWVIWHLWKLTLLVTVFGKAGGICKPMSVLFSQCNWCYPGTSSHVASQQALLLEQTYVL